MDFCSLIRIFAIVMAQKLHHIIISLASNFNQEANLEAARTALTLLLTEAHFTSAKWTKPFGVIDHGPLGSAAWHRQECSMYLNQLCQGTTAFGPNLLSEVLKETEKRQGRTHNEDGIVTLDLDLLQYDDQRFHLRDWERSYVKDLINEL